MKQIRSAGVLVCALVLAATVRAQTLVRSINGPTADAQFGKACIDAGDQDHDGFRDLLVGAPGTNSQRGSIHCISGRFLATGIGSATLWSHAPAANAGDLFGTALANIGDVNGDGAVDFAVGEPGYDRAPQADVGAVRLVHGISHVAVSTIHGQVTNGALGSALASLGDTDGDGRSELVAGAPGPLAASNHVYVLDGGSLASGGSVASMLLAGFGSTTNTGLGASVAAGFDLDGDSVPDFAVGEPRAAGSGGAECGRCWFAELTPTAFSLWGQYASTVAGEHLGQTLDAAHDYDGDGMLDVVVGAPNAPGPSGTQPGRAVVLSGARLLTHSPPYELLSLAQSSGAPLPATYHFGAAVRAIDDLNGDGIGDLLIGAPDFFTSLPLGPGKGAVSIFSGATGARFTGIVGSNFDHLGDAFSSAIDDLDGDGFPEFVVAGSTSSAGGATSGVIKCYRLFPVAPSTYCTGKLNSLGCTPSIAFSGSPSASSAAPFLVTASNFVNQKNGLLFYSHRATAVAFQGGTKCVHNPTVRTPPMSSGGSSSGSDCTGTYAFDFNAWLANGWDATLGAGSEVYAQYWSRDPTSASHTGLSNAVRFLVNP